jgi:membrane fusion protein (multidrug efflux system)
MSSPLRAERKERVLEEEKPVPAPQPPKRKPFVLIVLGLMVVAGAFFGWRTVHFYNHHATTDDAQVEGHIHPVLPRVAGFVGEVAVKENQAVRAGDILVRIDPADLQAKVDQELAELANAEAAVAMARAAVSGNRSNVAGSRPSIASMYREE